VPQNESDQLVGEVDVLRAVMDDSHSKLMRMRKVTSEINASHSLGRLRAIENKFNAHGDRRVLQTDYFYN